MSKVVLVNATRVAAEMPYLRVWDAEVEGRDAYVAGALHDANPHPPGKLRKAWLTGYNNLGSEEHGEDWIDA